MNLKLLGEEAQDGEKLQLSVKDMGACELYPQTIQHNPNGRFLVVCGDGEYIIYTSMALRNKAFGQAFEFVWAADSSQYAVRESSTTVKVFKNFKEKKSFKPDFGADSKCFLTSHSVSRNECADIFKDKGLKRLFFSRYFWRASARYLF